MLKKKNITNSTIICVLPTQKNIIFMTQREREREKGRLWWYSCLSYIPMYGICFLHNHKKILIISLHIFYEAIEETKIMLFSWWIYNNNFYPWTMLVPSAQLIAFPFFNMSTTLFPFKRPFVLYHFCIPFSNCM